METLTLTLANSLGQSRTELTMDVKKGAPTPSVVTIDGIVWTVKETNRKAWPEPEPGKES